jgi:hypothetical protein
MNQLASTFKTLRKQSLELSFLVERGFSKSNFYTNDERLTVVSNTEKHKPN